MPGPRLGSHAAGIRPSVKCNVDLSIIETEGVTLHRNSSAQQMEPEHGDKRRKKSKLNCWKEVRLSKCHAIAY